MTTKQAIAHFKTVRALADALGITTQAVRQWPRDVPELRALQLEKLTKGKLAA